MPGDEWTAFPNREIPSAMAHHVIGMPRERVARQLLPQAPELHQGPRDVITSPT